MKYFEEVKVWPSSRKLVKGIYSTFSMFKDYVFGDQICRAAISVMNDVAKGYERTST